VSFADNKFGLLTIIGVVRPNVFACRCKCGTVFEVWRSQLANNVIRHCGCRDNRTRWKKSRPYRTQHFRLSRRKNGNWKWKKFMSGELTSYLGMIFRCYAKTKKANVPANIMEVKASVFATDGLNQMVRVSRTSSPIWDRDRAARRWTG
jgi:hypothetical protein